jgi:hypothetical protein
MKKNILIYWASTGIISAVMFINAFGYFFNQGMINEFTQLGFPNYFRVELGIAKIIGSLALLFTLVPSKIKEFAYFGFVINFVSAIVAHLSTGNEIAEIVPPLVFLVILAISYFYNIRLINHEIKNTPDEVTK